MIISLITSLILTLLIEVFTSIILGIRERDDITVVICANICTNPVVVFIANCVRLLNNVLIYNMIVVILEISAIIVEFILYKNFLSFNQKSPLKISLINNIISFSIGIVINMYIL